MPPIAGVSPSQCAMAGVLIRFAANSLRAAVLEGCWTHACPRVLSIGFEAACPWLLVLRWSLMLLRQIHVLALVLFH